MIQWPAEAIWEAVVPFLPGFSVEVLNAQSPIIGPMEPAT